MNCSEPIPYTNQAHMGIAEDTWLEPVLARDKPIAADIVLKADTKLDATISGVVTLDGTPSAIGHGIGMDKSQRIAGQGIKNGELTLSRQKKNVFLCFVLDFS